MYHWIVQQGLYADLLQMVLFGLVGWLVAKLKLLPLWHKHVRNQEAILRALDRDPDHSLR